MFGWEGRPFDDIARLTLKRDPRRYRVGCATGDDEREYVQWFRTVPELVQFLLRMEPQRWGIRQAALIDHKSRLQPVLTEVDVKGLQEPLREALNAVTEPTYRIVWWGAFETLCRATQGWPGRLRQAAGAEPGDQDTVAEYLRERARAS